MGGTGTSGGLPDVREAVRDMADGTEASTADTVDSEEPGPNASRILAAAERCFSRFGYQKTSMENIAVEAGVSRRSIYRHFPDKSILFSAVRAARARIYLAEIVERTAQVDGLSAQIEEVWRLTTRFLEEDPINAANHPSDPDSLARAVTTEGRELLAMAMDVIKPLIAGARDQGEVRRDLNIDRAAEWIARMVFSLAATPSVTFDREDPEQTTAFIREFLVPGMC